MRVITKIEMFRAIAQAANSEKAGFVYNRPSTQGCKYTAPNNAYSPNCLIGKALLILGLPIPNDTTACNCESINSHDMKEWTASHGYTIDAPALTLAGVAQDVQDNGSSWDRAVVAAALYI